jgi:hypothetical protein
LNGRLIASVTQLSWKRTLPESSYSTSLPVMHYSSLRQGVWAIDGDCTQPNVSHYILLWTLQDRPFRLPVVCFRGLSASRSGAQPSGGSAASKKASSRRIARR